MAEMEILEIEESANPNKDSKVFINENGVFKQAEIDNLLRNSDTISDVNTSLNEVKFDDVAGGKNKFVPNKLNNVTIAGEDATITYNDDGSFTINGTINTPWRKARIGSAYLKQGSYVFTIKNWQLFNGLIYVETNAIGWAMTNTTSIDIAEATKELYFDLSLNVGTYNDVTVYPLLMESGSSPEFEKYIPSIPKLETDIANVKNTLYIQDISDTITKSEFVNTLVLKKQGNHVFGYVRYKNIPPQTPLLDNLPKTLTLHFYSVFVYSTGHPENASLWQSANQVLAYGEQSTSEYIGFIDYICV